MPDYDFKILQPYEFECLSRDLIQSRDNVFIESFTVGKDGCIDFRYAMTKGMTAIIQVKAMPHTHPYCQNSGRTYTWLIN
jgi:hypothetical protein